MATLQGHLSELGRVSMEILLPMVMLFFNWVVRAMPALLYLTLVGV
jgi:hypothetical protein